ncbi:hypothetical protein EDD16DRAFT_1714339 [Pisolithus croceorrhizus]|nr:hypothetical protein EDD16DRAFT_1714339 [Pisolithus croceorrhizus]KAI6113304.1 hypothetical protein EV401DRAFT_2074610 [Pisolithus croceorrhizus]KAI6167749.1 hypothetical protein EDD17DRAFT_1751134 [Pisolithus thermaeus]
MDDMVKNDTHETHWELLRDDGDKLLDFLFPDEVLFPKGMGELAKKSDHYVMEQVLNHCIDKGLCLQMVNPASGSSKEKTVSYWPGAPQLDMKPTACEGLLVSFLNLVVGTVNQACVMVSVRVWSADLATHPLSGGNAMRKPDLSCWLAPGSKFDWRHLATFAEVKNHMGRDDERSLYIEMAGKVSCLLYAQDGHHAAPCLCILGSLIYPMVFDHGGSLSTCGYDINHNPCEFLCILIGVTSTPCNILRFNTSINWGKRSCKDGEVVDMKELKIEMDATTCTIELKRLLFISDNLFGQGTMVWEGMMRVRGTGGMQPRKVAMKDLWIDSLRKYTKGKILSILDVYKVKGIPTLVHEEQVKVPYPSVIEGLQLSSSTHFLQAYLAHYKTNPYYLCVLSCIVTHPVGDLITEFSCLGELLVAFLDYIVSHKNMVEVTHVLHHDISLFNLLLASGTWLWMAAQLVMAGTGQPMVHDATHDLELFLYVLISICILLDEPYKLKCNSDLMQCFDKYFNTFEPSILKTIMIQLDLTWKPFLLQHISDYFKPIINLLTHLCNTIIVPLSTDGHGNVGHKTPFTHDMFIATIIQMLSELGPDAWMAVSQVGNNDEVGSEMEIGGKNGLKLADVESEVDPSPDDSADESSNGAMQDELVNPMAPGYAEDEQESQILPWAVELIPPLAEQSPEVQPSFKHSQPGQPFSFKLPSQASTGGMQSTRSYNSHPSSGNPSIFLAPVSQGSSMKSETSHHISHPEGDALDSLEGPISEMTSSFAEAAPNPLPATSVASGIVPNSNSDPSHLQFYTPPIHDIIEHAKHISHCNIVSVNSFPLCADFNHKTPEYMNEAIAECCSQGLAIPDASIFAQYYKADHGNWCSALKKKARMFVCDCYEWDPQNCCPINSELAKSLLEHVCDYALMLFAYGHTNNLAHPALSRLIINFFYMGSNAIASIFPEVFEKEVPHTVVVLAATTIKVALDEMVMEGKEVIFKHDIYADVYIDLLGLMVK